LRAQPQRLVRAHPARDSVLFDSSSWVSMVSSMLHLKHRLETE